MRKIKGVNEIHVGKSRSEIKKVKEIIEGLSRKITSLMAAKSIEPQAYNQFDHDSYPNQANAINVMRKQPNYNLNDGPLQEWLTHFGLVFDEINAFLDSWNSKKKKLTPSGKISSHHHNHHQRLSSNRRPTL